MTIGTRFARYLNPILDALRDLGGSARPREVYDWVATHLGVTDSERAIENQSGASRFENDVAWARFYLVRAGFVDSSQRGVWSLTERGRSTGTLSNSQIQLVLRQVQARTPLEESPGATPERRLEESEQAPPADLPVASGPVGSSYRDQAIEIMRQLPPRGFEQLCQRIMRESGFQQVKVTGRSGDGGIDGIGVLQINPFVTFKVLFQSKRYSGPVSAAQVRDFRGAMMGRADKGLIITTGTYTADAQVEAVRDGVPPIELVDGQGLVSLLEQLELGLTPQRTFVVDPKFFDEFRVT